MQFATRKTADVSIPTLATRLYSLPNPTVRATAEAALLAANPELLADFTRIPLGALIIVPDLVGATVTAEVRAPGELAASTPAILLRAMDEVIVQQIVAAYSAEAADASTSVGNLNLVPLDANNRPNWQGYVQQIVAPGAQARHDASVLARDGAPAKWKPLQDDLIALIARFNA